MNRIFSKLQQLLYTINFPLFIPDIKTVDESEELLDNFVNLYNMGDDIQYKESTDLPFGIKAYSICGRHEMALKFVDFLVVGDSAYGIEGKLAFDPTGIHPDENSAKSIDTAFALVPIIKKTMAR